MNQINAEKNGFKWIGLSVFTQYLLQVVSFLVIARLIGPYGVGLVAACLFTINLLKIFMELGFPQSLIQNENVELDDRDSSIIIMLLISTFLMMLIYAFSENVSSLFDNQEIAHVLPILSCILPLGAISLPFLSWLQREMQYKNVAIINIISSLIAFPLVGVTLAFLDFGVWSLILSNLSFAFFNLLGAVYACRSNMFKFKRVKISKLKKFQNFLMHFTLARFANFIALEFDNFIVGWKFGVASLGIYSRSYQLMTLPATLIGTIGDKVLFPLFSRVKDNSIISESLTQKLNVISFCTIPLSILVMLISDDIILFILGPKWAEVSPLLQILSLALFFRVATKFIDATVRALGFIKERALRQYFYAFVVIISVFLASFYSLEMVAYAVVFSIIINFLIMYNFISKKLVLKKRNFYKNVFIHIICSTSSVILASLILNLPAIFKLNFVLLKIIISTVIFLAFYISTNLIIKYLTRLFHAKVSK